MKLTIVSVKSKAEHEVTWMELNTPDGNFVIQPHHSPTTFVLSAHKEFIYCLKTGKHETLIPEKPAILSLTRSEALLLLT